MDCPRTGRCIIAAAVTDQAHEGAIRVWALEGKRKVGKFIVILKGLP